MRPQVDHVSGHALSPAHGTGGRTLHPHRYRVRPNLSPLKRNRFGSMSISPRLLRGASSRQRVTTGALGLRAESAGLFQFGLTTLQLGGNGVGQGSKAFPGIGFAHGSNHEAVDEQEVGRVVQGHRNVQ